MTSQLKLSLVSDEFSIRMIETVPKKINAMLDSMLKNWHNNVTVYGRLSWHFGSDHGTIFYDGVAVLSWNTTSSHTVWYIKNPEFQDVANNLPSFVEFEKRIFAELDLLQQEILKHQGALNEAN